MWKKYIRDVLSSLLFRRTFAFVADLFFIELCSLLLWAVLLRYFTVHDLLLKNFTFFLCFVVYFILFALFKDSRTIGKRIARIKTVTKSGEKLGLTNTFLRTLLLFVLLYSVDYNVCDNAYVAVIWYGFYSFLLALALLLFLFEKNHRTIHDFLFRACVIDSREHSVSLSSLPALHKRYYVLVPVLAVLLFVKVSGSDYRLLRLRYPDKLTHSSRPVDNLPLLKKRVVFRNEHGDIGDLYVNKRRKEIVVAGQSGASMLDYSYGVRKNVTFRTKLYGVRDVVKRYFLAHNRKKQVQTVLVDDNYRFLLNGYTVNIAVWLDSNGKELWRYRSSLFDYVTFAIAGRVRATEKVNVVLVLDGGHRLQLFDTEGKAVNDMKRRVDDMVLADMNNDGKDEIIYGNYAGDLKVIDADGTLLMQKTFPFHISKFSLIPSDSVRKELLVAAADKKKVYTTSLDGTVLLVRDAEDLRSGVDSVNGAYMEDVRNHRYLAVLISYVWNGSVLYLFENKTVVYEEVFDDNCSAMKVLGGNESKLLVGCGEKLLEYQFDDSM